VRCARNVSIVVQAHDSRLEGLRDGRLEGLEA
jgi:hypothetical protein